MRTIIAGSRELSPNIEKIVKQSEFNITTVLCGCAKGPDTYGKIWAENHNIPVENYPADWPTYGKRAGYLRNLTMAHNADALIAIWDGYSKGTTYMIDLARTFGLQIFVYLSNEV